MNKDTAIVQFNDWVSYMPDFLAEFRSLMGENALDSFDLSLESLDLVELWILNRYPDTKEMLTKSESHILNLLACYIGETMIHLKGGRWDLQLDPKYAFYGVPVVILPTGEIDCPLTLATASADRRTGKFLRSVIGGE